MVLIVYMKKNEFVWDFWWWSTVHLFSKLDKIFFEYIDPENFVLDNENK